MNILDPNFNFDQVVDPSKRPIYFKWTTVDN